MQKIITLLLLLGLCLMSKAQGVADILSNVETNNLTLKALRDKQAADKLDNLTGINLSNPNVEYNYFIGSPSEIGNRYDIIFNQSFDYATVFGYRKRLARSRNELLDIEYEQQKLSVIQQAKMLLVELIYTNAATAVYEQRLASVVRLQEKLRKAVAEGEETKLSLAKAELEAASATADISLMQTERTSLLSQLQTLNGGAPLALADTTYPDWSTLSTPSLLALFNAQHSAEAKVSEQEIKHARAEGMPELTAGYISELTRDEKFRGVSVGISIPLWSNHNNVKRAKARSIAQASAANDVLFQLQSQRDALTQRCAQLSTLSQNLAASLNFNESLALLNKALYEGEISLIEYLPEQKAIYDTQIKVLETEKTYQLSLAELSMYK